MNSLPPNRATEKTRTHAEQTPLASAPSQETLSFQFWYNVESTACYPSDLDFDWGRQPSTPWHKNKYVGKWATDDNNHKL